MPIKPQRLIFLIYLCLLILAGMNSASAQQKAMFTQYMFNGLVVNPAYSAIDETLNITALARQQWVGFKGAPNTQTLTVHSPIKQSNTSAGIILMRDQIGEVIRENGAFATLAHRVQLQEGTYLALGVNGGIGKYVGEYSLTGSASAATDPVFGDQNSLRGNFGVGLMLFSDKFYAGISSPFFYYRDLGGEAPSETAYKPHYIMQGGYLVDLGPELKFKPNVLVKYVSGSPVQVDVNANFLLKETIWLGGSVRSMDSFDVLAELQLTPNIQLGYSYDFTTSRLAKVEKGSHEIVLNFRLWSRGNSTTLPKCYF
ncbi:MAG: type IX secretion system membrane protein PorP/SprF [Daejeonella sp.]|uniref:PorP/SprF family type IX secretion system membrane protein n=1 Tax=Daejeonella sp. JGW-45 TaxID=3034148 RepID=UPI0023EBFF2C|nr:type IX secretion system membrane protein PorP/SprF [Daejeonella sp. JGW-45]